MLDEDHRSEPDDSDFWDVWPHAADQEVNWAEIVKNWVPEKALCSLNKEEVEEYVDVLFYISDAI